MGDFFHGWRRKAGCITLVMACLAASLWLMSFGKSNNLAAKFGRSIWLFRLEAGDAKFLSFVEDEATAFYESRSASFCNVTIGNGKIEVYENINPVSDVIQWGLGPGVTNWAFIPLWMVTIPLTLLSAYLILWKPRKRG